ncbi:carboxypeptidase-like regulatory domain-containing protein [Runella sp.]|uniref:carboxypeptidase-like regulatory domain-containing protein n=1 Tax=Runella sp. TaxID=1960881 RepID=UPI002627C4E0|nr:carboxypeptidase-like regulatory domain-containing protein [Runella sp.]
MKTKLFCLIFNALTLYACAQSTPVTVTGTVTEKGTKTPLPGINILIKNTKKGTTTDAKGHYSIKAYTEDKLIFSFVGYQNFERKIGRDSIINVSLKVATEALQESIVATTVFSKKGKCLIASGIMYFQ